MVIRNALTVDVEDYYHVSAFEDQISREQWPEFEVRVEKGTIKLLKLLEKHGVKGTFFVLGWIADRLPDLVVEIDRCGHEIGSHSYWHRLIYQQSPEEFRDDLRRSKAAIEDVIGKPVRTYRAPSFSITKQSLWALDILVDEGIEIDSSVFPIYHDRYGIPGASTTIHRCETSHGELWEFPASVKRVAGVNLPVSGGGYFRFYPISWSIRWLMQINRELRQPFVFYVHPWELDPQQPRIPIRSPLRRYRHYLNLRSTESKLDQLLSAFEFASITDVVGSHDSVNYAPTLHA